jgi:hypothetical protein
VLRFYVEGKPVSGEAFWQAVRDLGGQATITAHPPKPLEAGYRVTERGRKALERREAADA